MRERGLRTSGSRGRGRRGGLGRALLALASLLVLAAAAVAVGGWYFLLRADNSAASGKPVTVVVARGATTAAIASQLSEAGVIRNALMFRIEAKRSGKDAALKPGTYALKTGMPDEVVLQALSKGPEIVYFDIPIPEGFTAKQIAARFAKRAGVSEDEMLALVLDGAPRFAAEHPYLADAYKGSLEGYLFPATYRVKKGTKPEAIVEMMLDKFDEQIATIDLSFAKSKNLTTSDVVIIASILEREARISAERPLVSSVIYNRLKKDMRLQLCATVLYEMPPGTDKVTYADTKRDTPYNTYVHAGLPPGPISNPGLGSLRAAAQPKKTKYLYYVLTGKDGSQTFAATYDDFLKAKRKSQQVFSD